MDAEVCVTGIKTIDLLCPIHRNDYKEVWGEKSQLSSLILELAYRHKTYLQGQSIWVGCDSTCIKKRCVFGEIDDVLSLVIINGNDEIQDLERVRKAVERAKKDSVEGSCIWVFFDSGAHLCFEMSQFLSNESDSNCFAVFICVDIAQATFNRQSNVSRSVISLSRNDIDDQKLLAIDPLESTDTRTSFELADRNNMARQIKDLVGRYEGVSEIAATLGECELSEEDRIVMEKATKLIQFMSQSFFINKPFSGAEGEYVGFEETLSGVKRILD
ncbi:hypothetical protein ACIQAL_02395 [Pseudomonas sp. NPDC088368]|jgi:F0F1-type ATP synthase beta subunit|uniref:ATP synthase beta subunit C-terminal domain-containing protein n=1 Tax=Pseudomonas sp. NPDC088368 TaxID=3364453 RepID=UPI0037FACCAB